VGGGDAGRERAGPLVGLGWKGPAAKRPQKEGEENQKKET